jgi:hypothetical protein
VHLEFYSPGMNPKGHDLVKFYFIKKKKKSVNEHALVLQNLF